MEGVVNPDFWRGRRVFVTGHTGFKGAWLSLWLLSMGAEVKGYALEPPSTPSLYGELGLADDMADVIHDIRDRVALAAAVADWKPEVVLHLAAQSLVRRSYVEPLETYEVNVMGTANVLEAVRRTH